MRYYFKSKTMTGFKFKQFEIHQDRCAMKVGTDGVLLGAWAPGGKRILDVGSGTGLISLMMAQRFPEAQVLGIDMDGEACEEAAENVAASPFAGSVHVSHCPLQDFLSSQPYDAIVSNPPFHQGIHTHYDASEGLCKNAKLHLKPSGELWIVANRFLNYPVLIDQSFGQCTVKTDQQGFKVIYARAE